MEDFIQYGSPEVVLAKMQESVFIPKPLLQFITKVYTLQTMPPLPVFTAEECPSTAVDRNVFLSGNSLFPLQDIPYKKEYVSQLFGKLLALVTDEEQYKNDVVFVKDALEKGQFSLEVAYRAFLSNDTAFFEKLREETSPSCMGLVRFLLQSSIAPSLVAFGACVQKEYDLTGWSQQYCPVCGSEPLLGYWKGSIGAQYNVCSLCQVSYRASRMECMYCGEKNHEQLEYIRAEEFPLLVLQTCKTCKQYGKIMDYKESDLPIVPPLDDIYSLPMDVVASQQGFMRPVSSVWGF